FVFGTLPAVAIPLAIALTAILNTFTLVWLLTYVTDVSIVVQFLIALVGLGVAIDYALLMIFRFREELAAGEDVETALVETMTHAGRSVIVSGSTVAVGLLSMVILPLPFIRSIGIGGMLIPAVSVLASITLLPAMLAVLGTRINRVRVMPRRIVEGSDQAGGFWAGWSRGVDGAAAPPGWRTARAAVVEAIPAADGATGRTKDTISRLQHSVLPALSEQTGARVTLGGVAAEDQDFVHAVYGNFPYVLLF